MLINLRSAVMLQARKTAALGTLFILWSVVVKTFDAGGVIVVFE